MTERQKPDSRKQDSRRPATPPPDLSIATPDGLLRVDLYLLPHTETNGRGRPIPLYHLVLIRVSDGRAIADTRKTRHEARIMSPDSLRLQLSIPGDSDRFIGINLCNATCGEENFRGPTDADVALEELHTIL